MKKTVLAIFLLLLGMLFPSFSQDYEAVPCSYVSRHLNDTLSIGNTIISARIWCEKSGLYLQLDSATAKIEVTPCVWDFNYREVLDYNNGTITIENTYVKFRIFTQEGSPAIWIRGEGKTPLSIAFIKTGVRWPYQLDSRGLSDGPEKNFTIRISLGDIQYMNYRKAYNQNRLYWNELWLRSYIRIEGRDSTISNRYNLQRWKYATQTEVQEDILPAIKAGDWDIFKSRISKAEQNPMTLALMMKYFRQSCDETYLHSTIVPLAQKLLVDSVAGASDDRENAELVQFICRCFMELPYGIMIPNDLYSVVLDLCRPTDHNIKEPAPLNDENSLQSMILSDSFPREWNLRFRLWDKGNICLKGEFIDGRWKRKPRKTTGRDFFL